MRDGDTAAFTELRAAHLESARELARQLADGNEVEALVAQSFDRILEQLQAGRGPSASFRAYLHATIRDRHRDLLRNSRLDRLQPTKPRATAPLPVERPATAASKAAAPASDSNPPKRRAAAAGAAAGSAAAEPHVKAPAAQLPVERAAAEKPAAAATGGLGAATPPGAQLPVERGAAAAPAAAAKDSSAAAAGKQAPAAQLPAEKHVAAAAGSAAAASVASAPSADKAADGTPAAAMPAAVARAAEVGESPDRAPLLGRIRGLAPRAALALRGISSRTAVVAGATLMLVAAAAALWIGIQTNDADEPRADQVIVDPQEVEDPELRRIPGEVPFLAPLTGGSGSPSAGTDVTDPSDFSGTDPADPFPTTDDTDLPGTGLPGTQPPGMDAPTDDPSTPDVVEVRAVAPNATPIASCGSYGSLDLPNTTGVRYRLTTGNGREGPWEVRASAADGYALASGSPASFSGDLGGYYACPSIRSVSKVNVGGNDRGAWQITLAVDAPGPGPRTLEARFSFDHTTRIHGSGGAGWDCGSARIVGRGSPVTCSVVVDGGSPASLVLTAERVRLFRSTEPFGSVSLHEGGVQRGSAGF